jgi:hypothetical protein
LLGESQVVLRLSSSSAGGSPKHAVKDHAIESSAGMMVRADMSTPL